MRSTHRTIASISLLLLWSVAAHAFSLLGPFDPAYQTPELNYGSTRSVFGGVDGPGGDVGGPMNLGEEYRTGSPVLVYGFDSTFVDFFGDAGVAAVESAVAILNNLPTVPNMSTNLSEYPLSSTHFNQVAAQLKILDVKSMSLSLLLQAMGLAAPERFTWTLRERVPIPNTDPQQYVYTVIQRNFDPVTWQYSRYVNDTLYTYQIVHEWQPEDWSDCQEIGVNVANPNISVVSLAGVQAGATDPRTFQQLYGGGFGGRFESGLYFTGLTRDDVGAIRYLYRSGNVNWQAPPLGATGSSGGGGSAGGSPWTIVGFEVVNPLPNSPWTVVGGGLFGFTNTVGGGVITGTPPPDGGRGGPGKVAFVRVDTDPLLGQYITPVTIRYPETVINAQGVAVQTLTQRVITSPDILFTAADVGTFANSTPVVYRILNTTYTQVLNPGAGTLVPAGPGIIEPGIEFAFSKVGPWVFNTRDTAEIEGTLGFVWGSFDGSTNTPIVYPQGATAQELESKLFDQ